MKGLIKPALTALAVVVLYDRVIKPRMSK